MRPLNPSRRQFLKLATSALATTAATTTPSANALFLPTTKPTRVTKALIIGSGFGGSVTGLRLAKAGIPTLMLERGQWWKPDANSLLNTFSLNVPPDHRSSWFKVLASPPIKIELPILPYAGVLDYTDFNGLRTYQGAAVGGGSIVYGGVTVRSPTNVLQTIFGPNFNTVEFESKYYPRAEAMIGASTIPDDIFNTSYYRYAQVFKQHAEKAGYTVKRTNSAYDFDIIRREINGTIKCSALNGETIYGNNNGCKKSLDKSYLQQALATGKLTIEPLTEVERITARSGGGYSVFIKKITDWGVVQYYQEIQCDYLFMAAGVVGTNTLLLKAKAEGDLPSLNQYVGTKVGGNGDVTWARTVTEALGPKQAAPLVQTLEDFSNPYGPTVIECAYFPTGIDTHSLVQLGVVFDKNRPGPGTFTYSKLSKSLQLNWPSDASTKAISAHKYVVDKLNQVNGGCAGVPLIIPSPSASRVAHPLGGVPLGLATDDFGRLRGYQRLYVMDGSLIPGSCQVNPSLTITALAERNMERILAEDFRF